MAAEEATRWHPPLKAPAVEIIDLLSDEETLNNGTDVNGATKERDASGVESEGESDEDSQFSFWEEALNAEEEAGEIFDSKDPEFRHLVCVIAELLR
jgi:hypothetical protein